MRLRQRPCQLLCQQNLVPSLDEAVRNEVIAPICFGLHAFSASVAPKRFDNLVPNKLVEAFQDIVEARNEVFDAFWCDDLVPNLVEVVRNEVVEARWGLVKGKSRGFAAYWCGKPPKSRAQRAAAVAGRVVQDGGGRRRYGARGSGFRGPATGDGATGVLHAGRITDFPGGSRARRTRPGRCDR